MTALAEQEAVTRFFEPLFQELVPGAGGRVHPTIPNAGHFLQDHAPDRLVEIILGLQQFIPFGAVAPDYIDTIGRGHNRAIGTPEVFSSEAPITPGRVAR